MIIYYFIIHSIQLIYFFYEIFRQLVKQILNHELPEKDLDFLNESKIKNA